ncbi:hypothetical protein [Gordonia malaquae]|uniref:hypothetical protein n=1 Tax=Gordonia malaquae TaxID=410332 RepID=UPI00301710A6
MTKPRAEYAYYATRLSSRPLLTRFKVTSPAHDRWGSRIYRECMKAVDRLIAEEAAE